MNLKQKYGRRKRTGTIQELLSTNRLFHESNFEIDELKGIMIVILGVLADNNMLTQEHIDLVLPGYVVKE